LVPFLFGKIFGDDDLKKKIFYGFDLDETLFTHNNFLLTINVIDNYGNIKKILTNHEFANYKLDIDEYFDFSTFSSTNVFDKSAKPIKYMINKMLSYRKNTKHVEIITARSDMDDFPKFKDIMKSFGIDINKIHVRRCGNLKLNSSIAKTIIIQELIDKHNYTEVHLYDDSIKNISAFLEMKTDNLNIEFHGHLVNYNQTNNEITINTTIK
jgi:hypothetical protein